MTVIDWLLDSDPSIRWQVLRDLTDAPAEVVAAERARVATEGFGARLLALQAADGRWSGSAWNRGWDSTMHVLTLLQELGLDPASAEARRALGLVRDGVTWQGSGPAECDRNPFFAGEIEPCINGQVAASGAYFGQDVQGLVDRLTASSSGTAAGTARPQTARLARRSIPRSACSRPCSSTNWPPVRRAR
jgi:hypothetical protein